MTSSSNDSGFTEKAIDKLMSDLNAEEWYRKKFGKELSLGREDEVSETFIGSKSVERKQVQFKVPQKALSLTSKLKVESFEWSEIDSRKSKGQQAEGNLEWRTNYQDGTKHLWLLFSIPSEFIDEFELPVIELHLLDNSRIDFSSYLITPVRGVGLSSISCVRLFDDDISQGQFVIQWSIVSSIQSVPSNLIQHALETAFFSDDILRLSGKPTLRQWRKVAQEWLLGLSEEKSDKMSLLEQFLEESENV